MTIQTTLRRTRGRIEAGGDEAEAVVIVPPPPGARGSIRTMTFCKVYNPGTVARELTLQVRDPELLDDEDNGIRPEEVFTIPAGMTWTIGSLSVTGSEQAELQATDTDLSAAPLRYRSVWYDQAGGRGEDVS